MWSSRKTTEKGEANHQPARLPHPSAARLQASRDELPFDLNDFIERRKDDKETVLYLGYGSNLSNETFRGKRGIRPLAQINVQVPSLRVLFDLPGIPYVEPCFANSGLRDPKEDFAGQTDLRTVENEKAPLLGPAATKGGYRKDRWQKGLVGVVYEVTAEDYAHIIETEGGGAGYQDITVDCHPFATSDPTQPVPWHPTEPAFKAHTLFAPSLPPDDPRSRVKRPDPSYAQASARYLKLMTDGAAELSLPYEYQEHLQSLRPYRITSLWQRMGQVALLALWGPIVALAFALGRLLADDQGRIPTWLMRFTSAVFAAVWDSYDNVFKPLFGDGERTVTDGPDDGPGSLDPKMAASPASVMPPRTAAEVEAKIAQIA